MRVKLLIVSPRNYFAMKRPAYVPPDGTCKEIELDGWEGKKLKCEISYNEARRTFSCFAEPKGKRNRKMICFRFIKNISNINGNVLSRRGQIFSTGQFTKKWECYLFRIT